MKSGSGQRPGPFLITESANPVSPVLSYPQSLCVIVGKDNRGNIVARPPQEQDPWRAAADRLAERTAAAAVANAAWSAKLARLDREAAERTAEGQRRISGFLDRMRIAGNPGIGRHDLTVLGRHDKMIRRRAEIGEQLRDEDPDRLVVQGWVVADNSFRAHPRDSGSEQGDWCVNQTIVTVGGDAFRIPDMHAGDFGRTRMDPADITIDILVETLVRNGVKV
jgi:hypothetical protein